MAEPSERDREMVAQWRAQHMVWLSGECGERLARVFAAARAEGEAEGRRKAREERQYREVDIVFDGPPSHESGRFIEVESPPGISIRFGEWLDRGDGYWALRIRALAEPPADGSGV